MEEDHFRQFKGLPSEDSDASVASRSCGEQNADVAVWSTVELRGYQEVKVPHMWMGPGKARRCPIRKLFSACGLR